MAKLKNTNDSLCWRGYGVRVTLLHYQWECKLVQPLWKSVWRFLRKSEINLPQDPAILLSGIYPKDAQSYYKDIFSSVFKVALFVKSQKLETTRCLSNKEWIKKMWHIYTVKYY